MFCLLNLISKKGSNATLYFICIIFVKIIIIYWLILTVNHQGSYFPFFFVFIQWVKHFCTPANFITILSTVLNNKKIYTTYVLVCQNYTLIFSRTRKQNWIIICQCCLRIWRAGRGWGQRYLNVLSEGVRIFLLAVWGGGVRFSTSPSVKKK